jgi:ferredoxin
VSTPRRAPTVAPPSDELVVDPIACTGHGLCAELVPELVTLDDWGYPMVGGPVTPAIREHAIRAVKACPTLALKLRRGR